MSYQHLFILTPTDTPIYSMEHQSNRSVPNTASALSSNLPSWSTSAFAGTLTALSGAASAMQAQHAPMKASERPDGHVVQMIANASLDVIEEVMRRDGAMLVFWHALSKSLAIKICTRYLKSVEKFNEWTVSAFITPGSRLRFSENGCKPVDLISWPPDVKFILLHEVKNDDGIKAFFNDVWECYIKVNYQRQISQLTHLPSGDAQSLSYCAYLHTQLCVW